MSEEGFIIVYRKIMSWSWYTDSKTKALFLHCLLMANHKEKMWCGIKIERGSFVTSLSHLSEETRLTVKEVRTALNKLISAKSVAKHSTTKNTMITVLNYDAYQSGGKQKDIMKGNDDTKSNKVAGKLPSSQKAHKYRCPDGQTVGKGHEERHNKQQTKGKQRATTNNENKYSHPYRDENTGAAPGRSEGAGLAPEKKQIEVSVKEIRQFAKTVYGGNDYNACDFRRAFIESGTAFPENWKEVYEYFCQIDVQRQDDFLKGMAAGKFIDKWGAAQYNLD